MTSESKRIKRAWILAMAGVAALAPVCIALRVFGGPPDFEWTRYPYLDKRWLILTYWGGTFGFIVLPLAIRWLLRIRQEKQENSTSWRGAIQALEPAEDSAPTARNPRNHLLATSMRIFLGLILATVMVGPPWHTIVSVKMVDGHEAIHWSGLQAISRGYTPYLGPASINYGPGTQLTIYAYMKLTDQFTIPGFRESNAFLLWVALLIVNGMIFWQLRLGPALLSWFLMFFISPIMLWHWAPFGHLYGFSGWAITTRFIGTLVLALSVCAVSNRPSPRSVGLGYLGIGVLWGLLSYSGQESFFGGLFAVGILTTLLYLTNTFGLGRLLAAGKGFMAGAIALYTPICLYYLFQGGLVDFWRNYFLVPLRFGRGYANTPWWVPFGTEGIETDALQTESLTVAYHTLPYLIIGVTILAIYKSRRLGVARLRGDRLVIVAASVAFLSAYSSALLRADDFHLIGTMFAMPVVVATLVFYLPSLHCRTLRGRWIMRMVVLTVVAIVFFPIWKQAPTRLQSSAQGRIRSYSLSIPPYAKEFATDDIERRYGPSLVEIPRVQTLIPALRRIKSIVGEQPTFVYSEQTDLKIPHPTLMQIGEIYFCANLNPGPIWLERSDLVASSAQKERFLRHFQANLDKFDFLVCDAQKSPEIDVFTAAFPDGPRWEVPLGRGDAPSLYVFGRNRRDR